LPSTNSANHLAGNLKEFWSIRINQQCRIVFRWKDGNAADFQITDDH
jgi:proteic killer suppression protein